MILYFGCWSKKQIGHYLYEPNGQNPRFSRRDGGVTDRWEMIIPWGFNIDGGLAPRDNGQSAYGVAAYHLLHAFAGTKEEKWWSVISWWDSSADTRPGSSSTFIIDQRVDAESLLAAARTKFPTIFERFDYPIVLPLDRHGLKAIYDERA